jgi:TPR repeat protein
MFAVGALFAGGHSLPADRQTAQQWFRAAAELSHGHAQMMLGRYLMGGLAGELNPEEGRRWLERAAAQGVVEAETMDLTGLCGRGRVSCRPGDSERSGQKNSSTRSTG